MKKGKGVKKGKKGKKFLKDKGHKNTGFKTVYHKEEWGKSSKVGSENSLSLSLSYLIFDQETVFIYVWLINRHSLLWCWLRLYLQWHDIKREKKWDEKSKKWKKKWKKEKGKKYKGDHMKKVSALEISEKFHLYKL